MMKRVKRLRYDEVRGSFRKGYITVVGHSRVMVAERDPFRKSCWRMGWQSRREHDKGYLTMGTEHCLSPKVVREIADKHFGAKLR